MGDDNPGVKFAGLKRLLRRWPTDNVNRGWWPPITSGAVGGEFLIRRFRAATTERNMNVVVKGAVSEVNWRLY